MPMCRDQSTVDMAYWRRLLVSLRIRSFLCMSILGCSCSMGYLGFVGLGHRWRNY